MRLAPKASPVLVVVLACGVLMSVGLPANAKNTFTDDDESRFEPYIERAVEEGLLNPCNEPKSTRFCPDEAVTRAAFAKSLFRAVRPPTTNVDYFTDDDGRGAETAINALARAGIVDGCAKWEFCPGDPIRRSEVGAMVVRAFGWELTSDDHPYRDVGHGFAGKALATLGQHGVVESCDPPLGVNLCPSQKVTRGEAARILVIALGLDPEQPESGEAGNEAFRFTDKFSDLELWDDRVPSYRNRVQLTDDGYDGSGLRVSIPRGSHFGADFKLHLGDAVGEEPEHLFFRYFLRLDPDWAPSSSGKLPGFSGVYRSAGKGGFRSEPGAPGWSARVKFSAADDDDPRAALGYYVYHLDQAGTFGDSMEWNESGKLVPGDWYCLEGEIELNTPGSANGVLRSWVDGTPAFETTGLRFRRQGEPGVRIESFWFNVYYGGTAVASAPHGLTVDNVKVGSSRVGCGGSSAPQREAVGDVTGDGYPDRVSWMECNEGPCVWLETTQPTGARVKSRVGSGVWASLDTQRIGIAVGDLDGDGRDDLLYRGRCEGSVRCWRAHVFNGTTFDPGQDWGRDSGLTPATDELLLGDWDGDGLDDLMYPGNCDGDDGSCWNVQLSAGDRLRKPAVWGVVSGGVEAVHVADVSGDGRDDIVYAGKCNGDACWLAQMSTRSGFSEPKPIGDRVGATVVGFADLDNDARADLVTVDSKGSWEISVQRYGSKGLGPARSVATGEGEIVAVYLKAAGSGPGSILIQEACEEGRLCSDTLLVSGGDFMTVAAYVQALSQSSRLLKADGALKPPLPRQVEDRYFKRLRLTV